MRSLALAAVHAAQQASNSAQPQLNLIAIALHGKTVGFEKVLTMIDEMVALLKDEQVGDDEKKTYCTEEFDKTDDTKKGLERSISQSEKAIEDAKESIATLTSEIEALVAGIKALDKSVAEATENRKEENADYKELMANDAAAKEVILFAKNRLNKFYNPKLYVPPPKRELSEEDKITTAFGGTAAPTPAPGGISGTGVTAFAQLTNAESSNVAPPPPPETFKAYTKKGEESNGVMAMIDMLVKDLDKEMQTAEADEKDAQADYETMMVESAEKRAMDSKSITEKEGIKADTEAALQKHTEEKDASSKELMATLESIKALHSDCDWLMQYFDVRKEARASEIESLGKAKAVLSGADYSLLQTVTRSFRM
jgi:septal ring factor EnvC (AmiA/AmiB activator)